eukprot:symbB.v1.2.025973.t2/scaffold2560.1/size76387/5
MLQQAGAPSGSFAERSQSHEGPGSRETCAIFAEWSLKKIRFAVRFLKLNLGAWFGIIISCIMWIQSCRNLVPWTLAQNIRCAQKIKTSWWMPCGMELRTPSIHRFWCGV